MIGLNISIDDVIWFLDMLGSSRSPNHVAKLYKHKPYLSLLSNKDSDDYKKFICVYRKNMCVLTEKEKMILEMYYTKQSLNSIADEMNFSREWIRKLINNAERKISIHLQNSYLE